LLPTRNGEKRFMIETARETEMEKGVLRLLQLRREMNRHKEALLKSGPKDTDSHQIELMKLDNAYGMMRHQLFYGRSKEHAQDLLSFLKREQARYVRDYGDVFHDLLVQVMDYVGSHDRSAQGKTIELTEEDLTLE
jgi:predicted membrane chloride channel (bestrophin family)